MAIVANDLGHVAEHNRLASVPLGTLSGGYAQTTTGQGSITAAVALTGLSVTVTVGSGRRIRVSCYVCAGNTGAGQNEIQIFEGATQLQRALFNLAAGTNAPFTPSVVLTPGAGAHTYFVKGQAFAGTMSTLSAATNPSYILVEDIGV